MSEQRDHAVVVGASIGGLLAARVLSETHAAVTVVERDVLAEAAVVRRGAPRGRTPTVCWPGAARRSRSCSRSPRNCWRWACPPPTCRRSSAGSTAGGCCARRRRD